MIELIRDIVSSDFVPGRKLAMLIQVLFYERELKTVQHVRICRIWASTWAAQWSPHSGKNASSIPSVEVGDFHAPATRHSHAGMPSRFEHAVLERGVRTVGAERIQAANQRTKKAT